MTPLEVAAGYTILANDGVQAEPMFIRNVVNSQGEALEQNAIQSRRALDPRVTDLPGDKHDGGCDQPRHRRDRSRSRILTPRRGKQAHRAMVGLPDTPRICWPLFGWDLTTATVTWGLSGANAPAPIWASS